MLKYSPSTQIRAGQVPVLALLIALMLHLGATVGTAQSSPETNRRPTIVIDPGHGGRDIGAAGLSGTTEKSYTLGFARKLAAELEKNYRIVLTRQEDFELAATDRTALANHHQAALFISLHCGASFSRQPAGNNVYFHRPYAHSALGRSATPPKTENADTPPILWRNAQLTHQKKSEQLARRICKQLDGHHPAADCQVYGLPILPLEGAAMPAVVIELGYLTNPSDEKKMQSAIHQTNLVKAVSDAVSGFLTADPSR